MSTETPAGAAEARDYATLGGRALAALIDNSVWLFAFLFFVGPIIDGLYSENTSAGDIGLLIYFSLWFNYFAFCEWRWGQTIGKNATRMMVVTPEGEPLSFGQASIRGVLRLIDWLVIGWVMIATGERHQRLGDRLAGTIVVKRPAGTGSTMVKAPELAARRIAGGSQVAVELPEAADEEHPGEPGSPNEKRPGIRGRLPAITWTLKDTIWGTVAGLILAVFSTILVIPFDPDLESDASLLVAQGIFGIALFAVPAGIASRWDIGKIGEALGKLGIRRFAASAIGWILLTMFLYYVFAGLFSEFVLEPEQDDIADQLGFGDDNVWVVVAAAILIAGVAPVSEELFFRGFLFSGLRSRMSLWPAAVISGLVFGMVHAPSGPTTVIPLAVLGVAFAWLYDRTGSLWPPIIAHAINNALALAILSSDSGAFGV